MRLSREKRKPVWQKDFETETAKKTRIKINAAKIIEVEHAVDPNLSNDTLPITDLNSGTVPVHASGSDPHPILPTDVEDPGDIPTPSNISPINLVSIRSESLESPNSDSGNEIPDIG